MELERRERKREGRNNMVKCANCGSSIRKGQTRCIFCRIIGAGKGKKKYQPTKAEKREIAMTNKYGHPFS